MHDPHDAETQIPLQAHLDSPNRTLLAILQTDVKDFSRMSGLDEASVAQRVIDDKKKFTEICRRYQGQVLNNRGDGLKMVFETGAQAMRAAIEMQKYVRTANERPGETTYIQHRMGLHFGPCIKIGDEVSGHGAIVAARLEAIADPGQICFCREIYDQSRRFFTFPYRYMGSELLKGIDHPVRKWMTEMPLEIGALSPRTPNLHPKPTASSNPGAGAFWIGAFSAVLFLAILAAGGYFAWTWWDAEQRQQPPSAIRVAPKLLVEPDEPKKKNGRWTEPIPARGAALPAYIDPTERVKKPDVPSLKVQDSDPNRDPIHDTKEQDEKSQEQKEEKANTDKPEKPQSPEKPAQTTGPSESGAGL